MQCLINTFVKDLCLNCVPERSCFNLMVTFKQSPVIMGPYIPSYSSKPKTFAQVRWTLTRSSQEVQCVTCSFGRKGAWSKIRRVDLSIGVDQLGSRWTWEDEWTTSWCFPWHSLLTLHDKKIEIWFRERSRFDFME